MNKISDYIKPGLILLFFINFFSFSSFSIMNMLPAYLSMLEAGKGFIGFFMNVNSLEIVIFVLLFGKFSNIINRKKALISGFAVFIFSMTGMYIFHDSLMMLLIFRITGSCAYVFGFTLITNIFFDMIPDTSRTSGMALFGISGILSNPFGAILGETIIKFMHPKYLFILSIAVALVVICLTLFLKLKKNESISGSISFRQVIGKKNIKPLIVQCLRIVHS